MAEMVEIYRIINSYLCDFEELMSTMIMDTTMFPL